MSASWLDLPAFLLRPERPDLSRCLAAREEHLESRRLAFEARKSAITACERRIESARADVFAADNGVVGARMTDLEREWRRLSKVDPEAGLMELWARIAPPSWIDRKRWRDSAPCTRVDAATALAADVEGVELVERAAFELFGADTRVRWVQGSTDVAVVEPLFADALRAVEQGGIAQHVVARAQKLAAQVHDLVRARIADRPALARDVAHAAYVDCMVHPSRMRPLHAIWRAGYVVTSVDAARGITIEIPPL